MSRGERGISLFSTAKELKDCRKKEGGNIFSVALLITYQQR